jgi:hypothetical protein
VRGRRNGELAHILRHDIVRDVQWREGGARGRHGLGWQRDGRREEVELAPEVWGKLFLELREYMYCKSVAPAEDPRAVLPTRAAGLVWCNAECQVIRFAVESCCKDAGDM